VISHIQTVHSSDPNFRVPCGLEGCSTTSRSFLALYFHIYHHHSDVIKKRNCHSLMHIIASGNETTMALRIQAITPTDHESDDLNDIGT